MTTYDDDQKEKARQARWREEADAADPYLASTVNHAGVVRWGNTFYVIGAALNADLDTAAATREGTEALALTRFTFTGPCTKSNPDAVRARNAARQYVKEVIR